jgi:hypothetical protein
MRRVALLVGVAGALFGGFHSYSKLKPVLPTILRNRQFERLASLEGVQHTIQVAKFYDQQPAHDSFIPDAPPIDPKTGEPIGPPRDEWEAGIRAPFAFTYFPNPSQFGISVPRDAKCHAVLPPEHNSGTAQPLPLVCWGKDYTVVAFESWEKSPLPWELEPTLSAWEYCWCASWPILGFFIPWVAVRLIAWALAGFAATPAA